MNPKGIPWNRGDGLDRIASDHVSAESIYERDVYGVLQIIERIKIRGNETQDIRPLYRLVEVRDEKPRIIFVEELLRVAQRRADLRACGGWSRGTVESW